VYRFSWNSLCSSSDFLTPNLMGSSYSIFLQEIENFKVILKVYHMTNDIIILTNNYYDFSNNTRRLNWCKKLRQIINYNGRSIAYFWQRVLFRKLQILKKNTILAVSCCERTVVWKLKYICLKQLLNVDFIKTWYFGNINGSNMKNLE
jgi:hypothetical protein